MITAQITGIGWVNASGSGRGRCDRAADWFEGTPSVPKTILKSIKGGSRFGRLDLFSQIGVAAIGLALQDAGQLREGSTKKSDYNLKTDPNPLSTGLICATTSSSTRTDQDFFQTLQNDPRLASPGLFVYTLATSFLGEAALRFSLTGLTMALIEPRPQAAAAICTAIEELNSGDDEIMLAGLCNLFTENAEAEKVPPVSGALFLVLEKETEADLSADRRSLATLSCDPRTNTFFCNHQPCPDIFTLQKIICG